MRRTFCNAANPYPGTHEICCCILFGANKQEEPGRHIGAGYLFFLTLLLVKLVPLKNVSPAYRDTCRGSKSITSSFAFASPPNAIPP